MKVKILSSFPKQTYEFDQVFFSSDLHLNHEAVIKFGRKFENVVEMNDSILFEINKVIRKNDLLVLLGDTMMGEKDYAQLLESIVCDNVIMLFGNHCNRGKMQSALIECDKLIYVGDYLELNINKQIICCSHFPQFNWNYQDDGSISLHGHCIDIKTEVLTTKGWKKYNEISVGESIYSITNNGIKENRVTNFIINKNYQEDVYLYDTRFASMCVTDKHRMIENISGDLKYTEAHKYFSSHIGQLILSGKINKNGISLSDDLLTLYIFLAADGNYNKLTNLARTSLKKERKIKFIEDLLIRLNLKYSKNPNKEGGFVFNFQLPSELKNYNIKGLDLKLINCSEKQVDIIVDIYSKTDGNINNNTIVIYTSKREEVDLLQHILSINNYSTTVSSRVHGFSTKESFQLSVSKNRNILKFGNLKNKVRKVKAENNIMWCVTTEEGNFLCRRNGKTYFTGNCHADESPTLKEIHKYKSLDVGIDNFYKIFGEYSVFSFGQIQEILKYKLLIGRH